MFLSFAVASFIDPVIFPSSKDNTRSVTIGTTEILCFTGKFHSNVSKIAIEWIVRPTGAEEEISIKALHVTDDLHCTECDCEDELLALPKLREILALGSSNSSNNTMDYSLYGDGHFAAISIMYGVYSPGAPILQACGEPNRFVSFLVIGGVRPEDGGSLEFRFSSPRIQVPLSETLNLDAGMHIHVYVPLVD